MILIASNLSDTNGSKQRWHETTASIVHRPDCGEYVEPRPDSIKALYKGEAGPSISKAHRTPAVKVSYKSDDLERIISIRLKQSFVKEFCLLRSLVVNQW